MKAAQRPHRSLSRLLLLLTLTLALVLGLVTAIIQLHLDIRDEKDAVERAAKAFLDSVVPSAATAVYNYHNDATEQVIAGLFAQRAIRSATVWNGGTIVAKSSRTLKPTLPAIGAISRPDEVVLQRDLLNPEAPEREKIGEITVIVDRSVVPPAVVNRIVSYFVLHTVESLVFGLALVVLLYTTLTRHIVRISEAAGHWQPGSGAVTIPNPPRVLIGTEIEYLGQRIQQMSGSAETLINTLETSSREVRQHNSELNQKSSELSEAVKARTAELKSVNIALKYQAERDALTGLLNRGTFDLHAQEAMDEARKNGGELALLMIDVDHFKPYNDHYGHQEGDHCLKKVATALKEFSDDKTLVARYGGEEFVCLIKNSSMEAGYTLATNIHRALENLNIPHERSPLSDRVTASIGLSWDVCTPTSSFDTLLNSADEALYEAKHRGRNRIVHSSNSIRERVQKRRELITDLLRAVEHREFEPFFQSQHDARTGAIVGMEALARWRTPAGEILTPGEFMPLAQDNGLVGMIDGIMFDKCTEFLHQAKAEGIIVPGLSLNLSESLLEDDRLTDRLIQLRAATDVPIAMELLELTELDAPSSRLSWAIDMIRERGFDIEIDDFGTGKTSILSLMNLRPKRLKIARELVMQADQSELNRNILSCVIEIGRNLGVGLLAEGVETHEQKQVLIDLGCDIHQGFLYSRPISSSDQIVALKATNITRSAS